MTSKKFWLFTEIIKMLNLIIAGWRPSYIMEQAIKVELLVVLI